MAGIIGSAALQISVAGAEIVPSPPITWVNVNYSFDKFEFVNDQICTVIVNGSDPIYLRANQGFKTEKGDMDITSFKVVEGAITYNWLGHF